MQTQQVVPFLSEHTVSVSVRTRDTKEMGLPFYMQADPRPKQDPLHVKVTGSATL